LPIYVCLSCGKRIEDGEEYSEDEFGRRRHVKCPELSSPVRAVKGVERLVPVQRETLEELAMWRNAYATSLKNIEEVLRHLDDESKDNMHDAREIRPEDPRYSSYLEGYSDGLRAAIGVVHNLYHATERKEAWKKPELVEVG